jgi:hypothetical protein
MVRKIVFATVSAALCLAPVTPALAQSYDPGSEVQAPLGATGALNVRIPLGAGARTEEPTYGLTFGMGQVVGTNADERMLTREVRVADVRFNFSGELQRARIASFDLANMDRDKRFDGLTGISSTFTIIGIVAVGVGVCLIADCFGGDDDDVQPN